MDLDSNEEPLLPLHARKPVPSRSRNEKRKTVITIILFAGGLFLVVAFMDNINLVRYPPQTNFGKPTCKKCNCAKELSNSIDVNGVYDSRVKISSSSEDKSLVKEKTNQSSINLSTTLPINEEEFQSYANRCNGSWIKFDTIIQEGINQNDSRIIEYIQKNHLFPSLLRLSFGSIMNASDSDDLEDVNYTFRPNILNKILGNVSDGFFVEAGGYKGENLTNTLTLVERNIKYYKWNGLLIQPSPIGELKLKYKNRVAWISDVCLSPTTTPSKQEYFQEYNDTTSNTSRTSETTEETEDTEELQATERTEVIKRVQCFPLFSILCAMGVETVDYLRLSVEGQELKVLNTIPFESVFIKVISVEFSLIPEGKAALLAFIRTKGYEVASKMDHSYLLFHKSLNYNPRISAAATSQSTTTTTETELLWTTTDSQQ